MDGGGGKRYTVYKMKTTKSNGVDKMKLSAPQQKLLTELENAPIHSQMLDHNGKQFAAWHQTYLIDAPYFREEAIGWIHCNRNKATIECLARKGYLEIFEVGNSKNGLAETDLVRLIK